MMFCQSGHDIAAFCVSNDVLSEWPWHCCMLCFKWCSVRVAMTLPHSVFQMMFCQSGHDIAAFFQPSAATRACVPLVGSLLWVSGWMLFIIVKDTHAHISLRPCVHINKYILTVCRHVQYMYMYRYVCVTRYQYVQNKKDGRCVWHTLERRDIQGFRMGRCGLG